MLIEPQARTAPGEVSHNLLGQRLGRKGQETRERILAAALHLLEGGDAPVTLTSVARAASVGMTTLYLYFPDLGELVLAALRRVMDLADEAFVDRLRSYWPDERLEACCLDFLRAHHLFWQRHARILHMRNSLADGGDVRFLDYRSHVSHPLLTLLGAQLGAMPGSGQASATLLATLLLTGFERIATVVTNPAFHRNAQHGGVSKEAAYVDALLRTEAGLLALAIGHHRGVARRSTTMHGACRDGR